MKSSTRTRILATAAVALGLLGVAGAAQARTDVQLSIGVPGVIYADPAPVYVQPQPYYVEPPQVYAPAPVYVQPAWGWREREWRREQWRREQWRREHWREREWRREHRHWD